LDAVQREEALPEDLKERLPHLLDEGIIERIGRGRGVRFILSRKFHSFLGQHGAYTRRKGLDRETNKALLCKHILENQEAGSAFHDLEQVLPALSRNQVQKLLQELKAEGRIEERRPLVSGGPELCAGIGSVGAKRRKRNSTAFLFSKTYMRRRLSNRYSSGAKHAVERRDEEED
jgi:hypothetical protein